MKPKTDEKETEQKIIQKIFSGKMRFKSPYLKDIFKLYNVEGILVKHKEPVPKILTKFRIELEKAQKDWEKEMDGMFK